MNAPSYQHHNRGLQHSSCNPLLPAHDLLVLQHFYHIINKPMVPPCETDKKCYPFKGI
jgi:hypothetical protein